MTCAIILCGWLMLCSHVTLPSTTILDIQPPAPAGEDYYIQTPVGPRRCHPMGNMTAVCDD